VTEAQKFFKNCY